MERVWGLGWANFWLQKIHQMHRDEVAGCPEGAELLSRTDVCAVQGFVKPGRYITVQGHPEFNEEIVREICRVRHDGGVFSDEVYEDAMARVANQHDGVRIARAFLEFLMA